MDQQNVDNDNALAPLQVSAILANLAEAEVSEQIDTLENINLELMNRLDQTQA